MKQTMDEAKGESESIGRIWKKLEGKMIVVKSKSTWLIRSLCFVFSHFTLTVSSTFQTTSKIYLIEPSLILTFSFQSNFSPHINPLPPSNITFTPSLP